MANLGVEVDLIPKLDRAKFEAAVGKLKIDMPTEIDVAKLSKSINSAISSIKPQKIKVDVDSNYLRAQINSAISSTRVLARSGVRNAAGLSVSASSQATADTQSAINNAIKKQESALRNAEARVNKMKSNVDTLAKRGVLNTQDLQKLSQDFSDSAKSFDKAKSSATGYKKALDDTAKSYEKLTSAQKEQAADDTASRRALREQQHLANLQKQAQELIENNPKVRGTSLYGDLQGIIDKASSGTGNSVELSRNLANIRAEMDRLGVTSENVGQRIRRLFHDHFNTAIAMAGLHLLQNSLQEIVSSVIDVDTAMTDLQKVSNATSSEYAAFLEGAEGRAKNLGATITDVIGATSEFSRLGYNLEESSTLGDAAVKYLNVSEYTNIEDAAQSLVSTMQAFGMGADEVGSIVDKFNEIGNNYAISSEGLGEAMQRSAASLAGAGNSLDESLALVTAANEVVDYAS